MALPIKDIFSIVGVTDRSHFIRKFAGHISYSQSSTKCAACVRTWQGRIKRDSEAERAQGWSFFFLNCWVAVKPGFVGYHPGVPACGMNRNRVGATGS